MSVSMRIVWLYFLLRKKLGLAQIGQPPRAPAKPTARQLRGLRLGLRKVNDFDVFTIEPPVTKRTVVYLHGGGYVQPIATQHWQLITHLARETESTFIVPCYGLSPRHKVDAALGLMAKLRAELGPTRDLVLMGDSAGGGLALSLAQNNWKLVKKLILISPWVDSEFGEESKAYEERDPWLNSQSLRYISTVWSGVGDYRRVEVSPLRGDMTGLPPTVIYAGDYELFYPDLVLLKEKMQASGEEVDFYYQPGGLHVFPLIPSSEGQKARNSIAKYLSEIDSR
jgi:acetyl esterase/lipase